MKAGLWDWFARVFWAGAPLIAAFFRYADTLFLSNQARRWKL
jgi:hypothetical protein